MSRYGSYPPMRSNDRKKRKLKNTVLNVSIGVVAILIIFVAGSLFIGNGNDGPATSNNFDGNNNEETEENNSDANEDNGDISIGDADGTDNGSSENNSNGEDENEDNSSDLEVNDNNNNDADNNDNDDNNNNNNDNEGNENDNNNNSATDGDWEPVGTVQEEPFTAVYSKDHVNWEEMTRALAYATGLDEDEMQVWYIRNGGDHETAIGTVGVSEERDTPYKVTISWVENEGWMPVSVEQQDSNPY